MMDNFNCIGIAKITSRGIRFNHLVYTCARAIHEQWYEHAQIHGPSSVLVLYDKAEVSKIGIVIMAPTEHVGYELEVADILLRSEISNSKLERYFESIQKLKSLRKPKGRKISK